MAGVAVMGNRHQKALPLEGEGWVAVFDGSADARHLRTCSPSPSPSPSRRGGEWRA